MLPSFQRLAESRNSNSALWRSRSCTRRSSLSRFICNTTSAHSTWLAPDESVSLQRHGGPTGMTTGRAQRHNIYLFVNKASFHESERLFYHMGPSAELQSGSPFQPFRYCPMCLLKEKLESVGYRHRLCWQRRFVGHIGPCCVRSQNKMGGKWKEGVELSAFYKIMCKMRKERKTVYQLILEINKS